MLGSLITVSIHLVINQRHRLTAPFLSNQPPSLLTQKQKTRPRASVKQTTHLVFTNSSQAKVHTSISLPENVSLSGIT